MGRAPSSDLVLEDRFLSRTHARLFLEGEKLFVEDLGSYNGTFLNGVRLVEPTPAHPGDTIRLSTSVLSVLPEPREETAEMMTRSTSSASPDSDVPGATLVRDASDLLPDRRPLPDGSEGVDELVRHSERLALMHDVHKALAGTAELAELLELILDRVFDHFLPEEAAIFLRRPDGRFVLEAGRTRDGVEQTVDSRRLEREVGEQGRALVVLDAREDERFAGSESILSAGVRSLLAAPLLDEPMAPDRGALGMIVLASRRTVRPYSEEDMELLVSLASVAALRIRNAALAEEAVERRRFEQELALARSIQVALLTEELPRIDGWELWAGNVPSRRVSGDFYKVVEREVAGRRELVLLLADVSGKGMAASLLTTALEAMTASLLEEVDDPETICKRLSSLLLSRTPPSQYATGLLALVEPASGRLRYTSAGHTPALVVRSSGAIRELPPTGQPLGLLPDSLFACAEETLGPGDLLVLYSDGITEAADGEDREYGLERLTRVCAGHKGETLPGLAERIEDDLRRFVGREGFADDRTLVMARRRG